MFMPFDVVRYTGSTLSGEIGNKIGEVLQRIDGGGYVVSFGNDAYVIDDNNLVKNSYSENRDRGPEFTKRRKHSSDEE